MTNGDSPEVRIGKLEDVIIEHSTRSEAWWKEQWRRNDRFGGQLKALEDDVTDFKQFRAVANVKFGFMTLAGSMIGGAIVSVFFDLLRG